VDSNSIQLVDLVRHYSTRLDVGDDLRRARYMLDKAIASDEPRKRLSNSSTGHAGRSMEDRLTVEQITALVAEYRSGASTGVKIAEKYGISLTSVKRLARKYGATKHE
jgi:hypothetical protein